jgi:peptidoglycan/LPS O-acetylase OafA/YrhL
LNENPDHIYKMNWGGRVKSSSGKYYIGLDHLRALAVFMVFSWHFIHSRNIVPLDGSAPWLLPLSLLTQGYTGVSLFMVLSGYIFARLTDGQQLLYGRFLLNRALRLLPLLTVVLLLAHLKSTAMNEGLDVPHRLLWGWLAPALPQGGWSVTVEIHFYVMLPLILWVAARSRAGLLLLVLAAVALRAVIHVLDGPIEYLSYYTMIGRLDQFLLGCLAYQWRHTIQGRHAWWALAAIVFCGLMSYVDHQGSMFSKSHDMAPWWIFFTTVEGVFYGLTVAWYDTSFKHSTGRASNLLAMVGRYSYSIYLLHTFVVFRLADLINHKILVIENTYLALMASLVSLILLLPVAALSYRLIEAPFLKRRVIYMRPKPAMGQPPDASMDAEIQVRQAA